MLKGAGCALCVVAFAGLCAALGSGNSAAAVVGFIVGAPVFAGGIAIYNRGRRASLGMPEAQLEHDTRAPVLYLRSFAADAETRGAVDVSFLPAASTKEEQMVCALRDFGPVVAIGAPGEKLSELGAARFYFEDHEWQEAVLGFMGKARLVVLRVGETDAFWWEVERGLEQLPPEKILFLLPTSPERYRAFRSRLASFHHVELAEDLPKGGYSVIQGLAGVWGILCFGRNWSPRYVPLDRLPVGDAVKYLLRPLEASFRRALRSIGI